MVYIQCLIISPAQGEVVFIALSTGGREVSGGHSAPWKVLGKCLGLAPVAAPFARGAGHAGGASGWSGITGRGWTSQKSCPYLAVGP